MADSKNVTLVIAQEENEILRSQIATLRHGAHSMKDNTYPYDHTQASRYTFTSTGKKRIVKEVVFTHTGIRNIVNMGFGDLLPDGSTEIFFSGSTRERTKLYTRILETYYPRFNKEFIINVLIKDGASFTELPFEPKTDLKLLGFLIKRIY
ncbi:MAG TPA: hypothetical protein VE035_04505 [Puia sp.]|nr:hypothetical protein [Puia sp.]